MTDLPELLKFSSLEIYRFFSAPKRDMSFQMMKTCNISKPIFDSRFTRFSKTDDEIMVIERNSLAIDIEKEKQIKDRLVERDKAKQEPEKEKENKDQDFIKAKEIELQFFD